MKQYTGHTLYNSEYRSLYTMLTVDGSLVELLDELQFEQPENRTDKIIVDMALTTDATDERFIEFPIDKNGKPMEHRGRYVPVDEELLATANRLLQRNPEAIKRSPLTDQQKQDLLTGDFSNTGDYLRETYRVLEQGPTGKHGYLVVGMSQTDSITEALKHVERSIGNYTGHVAFDMTLRNGHSNSKRFLEASMTDGVIDRSSFQTLDAIEGYNTDITNKFLLYHTSERNPGFVSATGELVGNNLQKAGMFSYVHNTQSRADKYGSDILIPLTKELVDALPFELEDTRPSIPHTQAWEYPTEKALQGDFIVLTEDGFYDEKYNSLTESSRPKVRGFDLDYANLYNMEDLQRCNTQYIVENADGGHPPVVVPITEQQQQALQKLPAFSSEKEPHGFFMKPLGPATNIQEKEAMAKFAEALDALGADGKVSECAEKPPWDEDDNEFASAIESLQEDPGLSMG